MEKEQESDKWTGGRYTLEYRIPSFLFASHPVIAHCEEISNRTHTDVDEDAKEVLPLDGGLWTKSKGHDRRVVDRASERKGEAACA